MDGETASSPVTGIEQALEKFEGSPSKLAAALDGGIKVTRQHVEHWRKVGKVPADKAPEVERVTGIPVELLCPGVAWGVVRGQASEA